MTVCGRKMEALVVVKRENEQERMRENGENDKEK